MFGLFKKYSTITREEFEGCLCSQLDQFNDLVRGRGAIAEFSFNRIKDEMGGAWDTIVDDMHNRFAPKITPKNLKDIIPDCATMLIETAKRVREKPTAQD